MRESNRLGEETRSWYERPLPTNSDRCSQAPLFADLVELIRSNRPLAAADDIHVGSCPHCQRTLCEIRAQIGRPLPLASRNTPQRRRWSVAASLAMAAALAFVIFIVDSAGLDLSELGFAKPVLAAGPTIDPSDSVAVEAVLSEIARNRADRDEALRIGADPWEPWTQLYRHLRALGRWEEALSEAHAFVEFARERDRTPARYSMYYTGLFDLGKIYTAIGDYEKAWGYHKQSLAVAREYQEWYLSTLGVAEESVAYAQEMASTLVPRLSALSTLAGAQGKLRLAWDYHNRGTDSLTRYFRRECADRGLKMSAAASLAELCLAAISAGPVRPSPVVKVREHLLREARLHRLDRNLDAAEQTLDAALAVPDHPFADGSRLDFNEPMERLYLAIARGDFPAARLFADHAAQHTGPREFDGYPPHVPIGITACAQLKFLKAVALAAVDRTDPEATRLMDAALDELGRAASTLSTTEGDRLSQLLREWEVVRSGLP